MSFAVKLVAMATQRKKPKHLARFKNNLPQIFFGASLLFMKFILICEKTWPPAGYRFLLMQYRFLVHIWIDTAFPYSQVSVPGPLGSRVSLYYLLCLCAAHI